MEDNFVNCQHCDTLNFTAQKYCSHCTFRLPPNEANIRKIKQWNAGFVTVMLIILGLICALAFTVKAM